MAALAQRLAGAFFVTKGRFIAFEGGEGCGKSTQARLLAEAMRVKGHEVVLSREPGGTPGAEAIRDLLLDPPGEGWDGPAEALLFAAARSDHVAKLIRPALARGEWVICDRFLDSSRAYQGGAGGIGDEKVLALHDAGSDGLQPDLVLLVEVSPDRAAERVAERDGEFADAIGGRDAAYHADVARTFATIADAEPERYCRIDGEGSIEAVQARVLAGVRDAFGVDL